MNKKEAAQILAILKAAYPNHYKMTAKEAVGTIGVWCMQFDKMPADIVLMAVNKHISTGTFPPSIHEVKDKISALHWEAYEKISVRSEYERLTKQQVQDYERIYNLTEGYRYNKGNEPKLSEMLSGNAMLLLSADQEF